MEESDSWANKSAVGEKTSSFGKPRKALIIFSGLAFAFAIPVTVLVWVLYYSSFPFFHGAVGIVSFLLAAIVLALLAKEPAFKGEVRKAAFLLLSTISVLLCATAALLVFCDYFLPPAILLCVNTGFSGLIFVLLVICATQAKHKPSEGNAARTAQGEAPSLEAKTQNLSPACSKEKVILLTATFNKGVGLWTNICLFFANIFGCRCKRYDKKVNIALNEIKKSLLKEMSNYPDYHFGTFQIASDAPLSFVGSVIGVK